ncbi:hypothetical protein BGZ60DRAFT_400617 [Tricladium varicosporioides]|nr:hypothetical protein BGZ60DRAFT_400617 [Hymenoscyphus varicosporioides]
MVTSAFFVLAGLCLHLANAAEWHFLRWNTPSKSVQFQKFSMQMVTPTLPKAGVYYLWPGLQDTANTGVYQEVLDGRSGSWWIAPGWCCSNPSLPWGDGFAPGNQKPVNITMERSNTSGNWTTTMVQDGKRTNQGFPLAGKNMNQAILAIELNSVKWDFGKLVWNDVVMVVNGTETGWCTGAPENYNNAVKLTISKAVATVNGGSTTCTIKQVIMEPPA